jgi:hypothetical protein
MAVLGVFARLRLPALALAAAFLACSLPALSGLTLASGASPSFTLDICGAAPGLDRPSGSPLIAPLPKAGPPASLIDAGAVWEAPAPNRSRACDPPDAPPPRLRG